MTGYAYRRMTPEQRREVLDYRRLMNFPLHAPPHFTRDSNLYLLTATNYEHRHIMREEERRTSFEQELLEMIAGIQDAEIYAWCILPNHYHVLARINLVLFREKIWRLHNGTSTRWNREENLIGYRKVWHQFTDRGIRNEAHFWTTLNYIHFNPVKHGYVEAAELWRNSSIHLYFDEYTEDEMELLVKGYPLLDYGKGWDW